MLLRNTLNEYFKKKSDSTITLKNNLDLINKLSSLKVINKDKELKKIIYTYKTNLKQISNMAILNKDMSTIFKIYNQILNSSSSSIIKKSLDTEQYIINTRLVNYKLDDTGKSDIGKKKCISINKIDILDKNFNILKTKYLFPHDLNKKYIGIEDVRLFDSNNKIYYIGSYYNPNNKKIQIVSNEFNINEDFNLKLIIPTFKTSFNWEKNWAFFNDKNSELSIIYKWNPIYICKIDYQKNTLNLEKSIENLPVIFDRFRGSTNGVLYDNKIWFIVHQQNILSNNLKNYEHNIVVFDNDMNLIGYSDNFKFEGLLVEFSIGMEITYDNKFVITYSTLDSTSKLSVFTPEYINSLINYI
jgi:hypothetical protein